MSVSEGHETGNRKEEISYMWNISHVHCCSHRNNTSMAAPGEITHVREEHNPINHPIKNQDGKRNTGLYSQPKQ